MTTPTQAQIEAAAKGIPRATAYAEQIIKNSGRFSDEVVNLAEQYLHFRDAAAAQVGETSMDTISDLTTGGKPVVQAGEHGLDHDDGHGWERMVIAMRLSTIERCAQVADAQAHVEECADDTMRGVTNAAPYRKIAAAIRKLKKPVTDPNIVHPGSDHPGPFPQEEP